MVIYLISSSKVCWKRFSLMGQMPTFLAEPLSSLLFKEFLSFRSSTTVAGVGETYLTHNFPFSVYSFGGRIEFRKSSYFYCVGYFLTLGSPAFAAFLPADV